ncbi:anti-sigma factor [Ramlibacter sp. AW1]|uniref:Anti-sigma factor n=1 Tax=Ramlibacter aurantiacus TaxID=2801330 RepID=A0A936ZF69_9BURK|nr:anti-sigma factor [Ramlibacter aurantiacus]MBL0418772.1 anti-sigma factor [Ramlibacter aurantiacus]
MSRHPPFSEDDLHALVDARLPADRAAAVQAWVDANPQAQATLRAWQAQREALRAHHAEVLQEAVPSSMWPASQRVRKHHARQAAWWRWGAMAASVLLAFGAGWTLHGLQSGQRAGLPLAGAGPGGFARQALLAHAVYVPESRHPVEVDASQQDHLVQWLSKRLGRPLKVPQLSAEGFELVGGRLLPGEGGARAQFMFQNAAGERLTLYVGALGGPQAVDDAAFRYVGDGATSSFYWVERGYGYAITGPLSRQRLLSVAQLAYRSLQF